jgi:hypothetical protein
VFGPRQVDLMSFSPWLLLIACCLCAGLFLPAEWPEVIAAEPAAKAPTGSELVVLKRILANWRAREQRTERFYFAWDSRWTPPKHRGIGVVESRRELWMEGDTRFRTIHSFVRKPARKGIERKRSTRLGMGQEGGYASDGTTNRLLDSDVDPPQGSVWNGVDHKELEEISVSPLLFAMRPLSHNGINPAADDLRVITDKAVIGNRHCVKIRPVGRFFVENFWVDPARDDVVVAWERLVRESILAFVVIDYQHDAAHGWIPVHWTQTEYSDSGNPSSENQMTRFTIDETFPGDTFTLKFPSGTAVLDLTLNEKYVVAKDGSKVNVEKLDSPATLRIYDALARTTDFTIEPQPLKDALDFIAMRYSIKVTIDPQAVRQGLINPDVEVKVITPKIPVRYLLKDLLEQSPRPLAFEVRNGVLTVTPAAHSK